MAISKLAGMSMRTARVAPPESMALATIEPSTQAATLSGWPSMRAASSRMRGRFQPSPRSRSAITTPAVSAAALDPRPFAERNLVVNPQVDGREYGIGVGGHRERGAPDQIVFTGRDGLAIAAAHFDRKLVARLEAAIEIDPYRQAQSIESGAEVGA